MKIIIIEIVGTPVFSGLHAHFYMMFQSLLFFVARLNLFFCLVAEENKNRKRKGKRKSPILMAGDRANVFLMLKMLRLFAP